MVETDAYDHVSAGILSQIANDGLLHPVAFFSRKHSPAKCNYEIYDKELMAIIPSFEELRPHLESAKGIIEVLCDHKNLEYFMTTKILNRRQARWSKFLSRFNFKINFRTGKAWGKPDALTRRSGDLPKEGDKHLKIQQQVIIKPENISLAATSPTPTIEELFSQGYKHNPTTKEITQVLNDGTKRHPKVSLYDCSIRGTQVFLRDCLLVPVYTPLKLKLIMEHHDKPSAGFPGVVKTLELKMRQYN